MNEELKPGALSSGLVQGNNKQDDRSGFAATDDLNNFLIRRQLLIMESKRIKELLIEAEAEVKAKARTLRYSRSGAYIASRTPGSPR